MFCNNNQTIKLNNKIQHNKHFYKDYTPDFKSIEIKIVFLKIKCLIAIKFRILQNKLTIFNFFLFLNMFKRIKHQQDTT